MPTTTMKPEWFAQGLSFSCTQCGNCCTGPPGFVWMTDEEAQAIADHLGMALDAFLDEYGRRVDGRWTLEELRVGRKFDCVFLERDEQGKGLCSIYSVRPQQCRTWPFWPQNVKSERAWARAAKNCPGMNKGNFYPADQVRIIRDTTPELG